MTEAPFASLPDDDEFEPLPGPDAAVDGPAASDLDTLRTDMAAQILEEIVLPVPARPGYESVHIADISAATVENLRKRSRSKTAKGGVDALKLVALVMATTNTGVRKDGRRLVTEDGEPLNYRSPEFLEIQAVGSAAEAVRRFYGRDGDLDSASRALLKAAGWGEDIEAISEDEVDPTQRRG